MMPVSFRRGRAVVFALLAATSVLLTSVSVSYAEMPHNRRCDIAQGIRLRAADPFQLAFQIVGMLATTVAASLSPLATLALILVPSRSNASGRLPFLRKIEQMLPRASDRS
jgi:hypothetical protein